MHRVLDWWRAHDGNLTALRRATRTAVVLPSLLAIGFEVIGNPTMSTFVSFGSIALLLLADFGGTLRNRVACQLTLIGVGCVLITVGTLASVNPWVATAVALVVGFTVLFAGAVSSSAASASTSALLSFILPVAMPADVGTIPDRLYGWLLAGAASLVAITVLWPAPRTEPLRAACALACRQLVTRLTSRDAAPATGADAVTALRAFFYRTPYRPAGLSTGNRAILRLVDELSWLGGIVDVLPASSAHRSADGSADGTIGDAARRVEQASAVLLDHAAKALGPRSGAPADSLRQHLDDVVTARRDMERVVVRELPAVGAAPDVETATLAASFRAHELSYAAVEVAANVETARRAESRTWWQQLVGRRVEDATNTLASVQDRLGSHWQRDSVWLHNSIRGAIGLGIAVLVADLTQLQHSFWIVLGALSVLRSSALTTGQSVARAIGGTVLGFAIGGAIVYGIDADITVLWVLLPVVIVFAGTAPAVSFVAGQAGFTMTILFLFNIISPAGWQIGFLRVENVAIGCAVSIFVGALFWPRGASAVLARTLSEAYADCAGYLRGVVAHVGRGHPPAATDPPGAPAAVSDPLQLIDALAPTVSEPPEVQALRNQAAGAARRLDDAFRGFLAERGTKHLALADVATLVSGVAALRLAAGAVLDLWRQDDGLARADGAQARDELTRSADAVTGWYAVLARALSGTSDVPAEMSADADVQRRLLATMRRDLTDEAGRAAAVRAVWTADHLTAIVHLQDSLEEPARAANRYVRQARTHPHWWFGPSHASEGRSAVADETARHLLTAGSSDPGGS